MVGDNPSGEPSSIDEAGARKRERDDEARVGGSDNHAKVPRTDPRNGDEGETPILFFSYCLPIGRDPAHCRCAILSHRNSLSLGLYHICR